MGVIRKVALAVLIISFIVFVALFGRLPALRSTPIGALHRLLLHRIPAALKHADRNVTGGRLTSSVSRLGHHLLYERHSVILNSYLILLTGAATLFLYTAWPRLPFHHHALIPPLLTAPYLLTYLCVTTNPGRITPSSHRTYLHHYPYDYTLYHPHSTCRTCHLPKSARSKHCPLCGTCIARLDHHCVWVNNCIGAENYRYFLLLLISLGSLLSYGAYLAWGIFSLSPAWGRQGFTWWEKATLAINEDVNVGSVGLLAGFTAPLAWGLFGYHLYLVWAGMTTNETAKWGGLGDEISDGTVWVARRVGKGSGAGDEGGFERTIWPLESDQIVVIRRDGQPPAALQLDHVDDETWVRVESLREVDNVYDAGFLTNLKDALGLLR